MTPSEYRYQIEKVYAECMNVNDWLLSNDQFQQFVLMAKEYSGSLVLDNWKIFLNGGGASESFFDWWMEFRPDKLESGEIEKTVVERKKSPFDAVKNRVRIM